MTKRPGPRPKRREWRKTFVKEWRIHRQLTQEQLAERVGDYLIEHGITKKGYSYATLGRLERGKIGYTQPVMEALAHALATDVASVLMRNPTDPKAAWSLLETVDPVERTVIERLIRASAAKTGTDG